MLSGAAPRTLHLAVVVVMRSRSRAPAEVCETPRRVLRDQRKPMAGRRSTRTSIADDAGPSGEV
jgi:hypothetical protein